MQLSRRTFAALLGATALPGLASTSFATAADLSPEDARAIAKEAYTYGFPMVDSYRILYAYFADKSSPEYKASWNTIFNTARVYTPADTAVQTPNSDTPYSFVGMDLRAEPLVLTVPEVEKDRYFSVQLVDAYTFNFDYIGTRATGNGGGKFMIAGPKWKGETPPGITKAMQSETEIALALYRTQLFDAADIENVKKVQAGYKVEPLSSFLGQPAPAAVPPLDLMKPLTPDEEKTSLEFFNLLNFILQACPTNPSETELMERFSRIGVGAGKAIDFASLSPEIKTAMGQGVVDAWADLAALKKEVDAGKVAVGDLFGTREYLKNNYLYRFIAAALGIFGNSKQEAMYPPYGVDADGKPLDGDSNYTVHFADGQLPPANAFWSLTMYDLPNSLLVANPIDRYLVNSPMLPQFVKDSDGGITIYVQNEAPSKDKQANWLPAPKGPFTIFMRIYWPKESALDGSWTKPPLNKVQ
ncbi:MAG: DUF1254 domain-containing protein [Hyphomicrobiales bacterium]|nr:DUF1254 domain-containing protein [Hyphomicrobiales bacterium]